VNPAASSSDATAFVEALLEESSDEGIVSNRHAAYLDALDDVSVERDELQLLLLR
jgi:hypothetical protein